MPRLKLPDDPDPDTEDRFNRLLQEMAKPVLQTPEEDKTSDAARKKRRGDIQTPANTSEAASKKRESR